MNDPTVKCISCGRPMDDSSHKHQNLCRNCMDQVKANLLTENRISDDELSKYILNMRYVPTGINIKTDPEKQLALLTELQDARATIAKLHGEVAILNLFRTRDAENWLTEQSQLWDQIAALTRERDEMQADYMRQLAASYEESQARLFRAELAEKERDVERVRVDEFRKWNEMLQSERGAKAATIKELRAVVEKLQNRIDNDIE